MVINDSKLLGKKFLGIFETVISFSNYRLNSYYVDDGLFELVSAADSC